ncbi:MAG: hypothetical protein EBT13_18295 [Rhodobacteraceae bacterium]|nr:hypothetical protein [Paracoccaceae bacterium]
MHSEGSAGRAHPDPEGPAAVQGAGGDHGPHHADLPAGGVGGLFGLASIAWELPLSTTLMLRSMLDVARSEGHSVQDLRTRISCLEVFAFGGRSGADDGAESGYWAVRAGLATMVTDAAAYIAQNGIKTRSAPVLAKLIAAISATNFTYLQALTIIEDAEPT